MTECYAYDSISYTDKKKKPTTKAKHIPSEFNKIKSRMNDIITPTESESALHGILLDSICLFREHVHLDQQSRSFWLKFNNTKRNYIVDQYNSIYQLLRSRLNQIDIYYNILIDKDSEAYTLKCSIETLIYNLDYALSMNNLNNTPDLKSKLLDIKDIIHSDFEKVSNLCSFYTRSVSVASDLYYCIKHYHHPDAQDLLTLKANRNILPHVID